MQLARILMIQTRYDLMNIKNLIKVHPDIWGLKERKKIPSRNAQIEKEWMDVKKDFENIMELNWN